MPQRRQRQHRAAPTAPRQAQSPSQAPQTTPRHEAVLAAQRTVGNRTVRRLLAPSSGGAPSVQTAATMLRWGSRGPDVTNLQQAIVSAGQEIAVDGIFGPETHRAVLNFQRANGLAVDGIVGPNTYAAIKGGGSMGGGGGDASPALETIISGKLKAIAASLQSMGGAPLTPTLGHPAKPHAAGSGNGQGAASQGTSQAGGSGTLQDAAAQVLAIADGLPDEVREPFEQDLGFVGDLGTKSAQDITVADVVQVDTFLTNVGVQAANQAGGATGTGKTEIDVIREKTWTVHGETIGAVGQELEAHMSTHNGEAAHVVRIHKKEKINLEVDEGTGRVVKAELIFPLERELPVWPKADEVGKDAPCWKAEWERFHEAVSVHEQEHVNIYRKFLTGLHLKVIGKTFDQAIKIIDDTIAAAEKQQEKFDKDTHHGQTAPLSTKFNAGISPKGCQKKQTP